MKFSLPVDVEAWTQIASSPQLFLQSASPYEQ